ncbi:MAG TPA: ABC transporter permease [Candidatus Acidoferrales bacterium]|nr:ABC transporter permease [Candidatus Acidoferrales bacterium]
MLTDLRFRLKALFRKRRLESEMNAELGEHYQRQFEKLAHKGIPPEEAMRRSRLAVGGPEQIREEIREARGTHLLESSMQDFRYAARTLRKTPAFTAIAVLTLALGIGANTAIFSVVNTVLLRPLPFDDSSRLVRLFHVPPEKSFPGAKTFSISPANFLDWQEQNHSFEAMAAYSVYRRTLTGTGRAESIIVGRMGPEFFNITRAHPELGRAFAEGDDRPERSHIAVISHSFWKNNLASNPAVLGTDVELNHERYTIVGVMPASFELQSWGATLPKIWVPLAWDDKERAVRGNHNYNAVARLKPGVSVQSANAELQAISARLAQSYPNEDTDWGAIAIPLQDYLVATVSKSLWVLLGAVGFVLLIACVNVANLVLARALSRSKEMAVRAALGAGPGRILRQVLSETLLLSVLGGAAGVALAKFALKLAATALADQLPRGGEIGLDVQVFIFALAVSVAAGLIAGIVPAMRVSRTDINDVLKRSLSRSGASSDGPQTPGKFRPRTLLIVCEVALSIVLVIGAGLMIRSLAALRGVNLGFDQRNLLTMFINLPRQKYANQAQSAAFFDSLLLRVRAMPGVQTAAYIENLPLSGGSMQPFTIEGRPHTSVQDATEAAVRQCTPGYIATMRIPLLRGRDFLDSDLHALLISQSMAQMYWPEEDPIGHRMEFQFSPNTVWEIIGIVGDVRLDSVAGKNFTPTIYQWTRDRDWFGLSLAVRASADPHALIQPVTGAVREIDPEQPVNDVATMDHLVDQSIASTQSTAWLFGGFSAIALALAAFGIYGVLSYNVRSKMQELGIRVALGASRGEILRMTLLSGMKPTAIGVLLGAASAVALGRVMEGLVFGVKTSDPLTFAAVTLILIAVALFASFVPALRATRVDPLVALRDE